MTVSAAETTNRTAKALRLLHAADRLLGTPVTHGNALRPLEPAWWNELALQNNERPPSPATVACAIAIADGRTADPFEGLPTW